MTTIDLYEIRYITRTCVWGKNSARIFEFLERLKGTVDKSLIQRVSWIFKVFVIVKSRVHAEQNIINKIYKV